MVDKYKISPFHFNLWLNKIILSVNVKESLRFMMVVRIFLMTLFPFFLLLFSCEKDKNPTGPGDSDTTSVIVRKPNIYIYPTDTINLELKLVFPSGGSIIESIPAYTDGWNIAVNPSGLINNEYAYLFYECEIKDAFQYESGWEVPGKELKHFFKNNLARCGFAANEIDDFIEYWLPLLNENKDYYIYPQFKERISEIVELRFSVEPENIIRLFYIITDNCENSDILREPDIPEYSRDGFTVAEWGVVIK